MRSIPIPASKRQELLEELLIRMELADRASELLPDRTVVITQESWRSMFLEPMREATGRRRE